MTDTADKPETKVIIYTATWCAFCHQTKEYLDHLGVQYIDKDIEKDPEAMHESVEKSSQMGIPVIDINGDIIKGFDKDKIDSALRTHHII